MVVDAVPGNSQCNNYDGTYSHTAESFVEISPCVWESEFDIGIDWDTGVGTTPVYSWLHVEAVVVDDVCKLSIGYGLYYDFGGVNWIVRNSVSPRDDCSKPVDDVVNSDIATPCTTSSTVTKTAV